MLLGQTDYYRKFVQGYGILARPLTNLLKKGQFGWNPKVEKAFIDLKKAMTSTPTLPMLNFKAFSDGIGAILQQQGQSIAFMSHAATDTGDCRSNTYVETSFAGMKIHHSNQPMQL